MRRIIVLWVVGALVAAACSRQESGWQEAARENSIAAYQAYLENFPAGVHAGEARAKVRELQEEAAWTLANRLRTPEAWQRYLGEWPDGRHAALARRQLVAFVPRQAPAQEQGQPPATGGEFAVQLGAYSNEAAARGNLARLAREHAAKLEGQSLEILAPHLPDTDVWRLRTGPLDETRARELCESLRSVGVDCVPVAGGSAGQPPP